MFEKGSGVHNSVTFCSTKSSDFGDVDWCDGFQRQGATDILAHAHDIHMGSRSTCMHGRMNIQETIVQKRKYSNYNQTGHLVYAPTIYQTGG